MEWTDEDWSYLAGGFQDLDQKALAELENKSAEQRN